MPTYKYILYTASPFAGYLHTNTIQSEFTPQLGASGGKGEDNFILQLPEFTFLQIKICVNVKADPEKKSTIQLGRDPNSFGPCS